MAGRGIAAAEDQVGAAAQGPRRECQKLSDASVACVQVKGSNDEYEYEYEYER